MEGLTPVSLSLRDVNSTYIATVNDVPDCTVSIMTDATDEGWMLAGFYDSWYPRGDKYTYRDPGVPHWPPGEVTVAQVAVEHPEICIDSS